MPASSAVNRGTQLLSAVPLPLPPKRKRLCVRDVGEIRMTRAVAMPRLMLMAASFDWRRQKKRRSESQKKEKRSRDKQVLCNANAAEEILTMPQAAMQRQSFLGLFQEAERADVLVCGMMNATDADGLLDMIQRIVVATTLKNFE